MRQAGGPVRVVVWSSLPQGSGMGGSSIVGAALLAVLGVAVGRPYDQQSLIHAVLRLEQLLTTGGGWQDQVGGVLPGAKLTRAPPSLPLQILPSPIELSPRTRLLLRRHLLLVFTGRARLAAGLLHGVVRAWHARCPDLVAEVGGLGRNAEEVAVALEQGDIEGLGACLSLYWAQKQRMAGEGSAPREVQQLQQLFAPYIHGLSLCGAGGGGFMVVVSKQADAEGTFRDLVQEHLPGLSDVVTFHSLDMDMEGLQVTVSSLCSS